MSKKDQEAIQKTSDELRRAADCSITASSVAAILACLVKRHREESDVELACEAMDDLSKWAAMAKETMRQQRAGRI